LLDGAGTYSEKTEGYGPDELCDGDRAHHLDRLDSAVVDGEESVFRMFFEARCVSAILSTRRCRRWSSDEIGSRVELHDQVNVAAFGSAK
jgi:hypothetical protein